MKRKSSIVLSLIVINMVSFAQKNDGCIDPSPGVEFSGIDSQHGDTRVILEL